MEMATTARDPTNAEIAAALDELGDLSELDGAIVHRIVAYRNAAKAVREAPVSVTALARQGRATELPGIGQTIQEKVLALADDGAIPAAVKLRAKFPPGLIQITRLPGLGPKRARRLFDELAGSARRMTDSVKDLDVIATASDPLALATAATQLELVESAGTPGEAGVRLRTHTGIPVDLRIVAPDQFGNLLQHLTGSKQHNMALRDAAVRKGMHVSEYGVLDDKTSETHRCTTEDEVYRLLGLEYVEPELRENR